MKWKIQRKIKVHYRKMNKYVTNMSSSSMHNDNHRHYKKIDQFGEKIHHSISWYKVYILILFQRCYHKIMLYYLLKWNILF